MIKNLAIIINSNFSNREIAIGLWLLVLLIIAFSKIDIRESLKDFIKIFFSNKLIFFHITMLFYVSISVFVLIKVRFWEARFLKDTIIWYVFIAIASVIRSVGKAKDIQYFKNLIKDNFKIVIILEYIINLYNFPLLIELISIPIITKIFLCNVFSQHKKEAGDEKYVSIYRLTNIILSFWGIFVLFHSITEFINDLNYINLTDFIKNITYVPIMSTIFVPYIYFFVLYSAYEIVFIRLSFKNTIYQKCRKRLYLTIILFCNFSLKKINNFIEYSEIMKSYVRNQEDIKQLINNYRKKALFFDKQTTK